MLQSMGSQRVGNNLATEQQHWVAGCHREAGTTIKPMYGCCIMTWKLLWIPLLTKPHTQMAYIQDGRDTPLQLLFSCSVVSDSLQPYGLQHARLPCPSPSPGVCWNSCPFSWWCHPTISSSIVPFYSCLQSFLASGSFPMSQFFASSGQSIGASASASVLPMNIQDWFSLGLAKGLSRVFSSTTIWKHQFFEEGTGNPLQYSCPENPMDGGAW